jgi:hypothetical protein
VAHRRKYTKELLESLTKESNNWTELFKKLGIHYGGGNYNNIKKHLVKWGISIDHFTRKDNSVRRTAINKNNLDLLFSIGSPYSRTTIKSYIYRLGLKPIECELCGLGEEWQGKKMSLILDHINGINIDHRLENLRLVCPNCNATLDTHCRGAKYMKGTEEPKKEIKNYSKKIINLTEQKTFNLRKQKIESDKKLILESDVDFTKYGWRLKAAKVLNCTPQWVGKFIKDYLPEVWEKSYKHTVK